MDFIFTCFMWFIAYSFIGWAYESTLCSITGKKLTNRGFLNGPICPVYGFGAVIVIFAVGNQKNNLLALFLSSLVLTTVLEYITSYIMEKLFHTRWWDYSDRKFNINGRVCLLGAVVFGTLSVLLIKFIHPFISGLIAKLDSMWLYFLSGGIFALLAADLWVTVYHLLKANGAIAEIQGAIDEYFTDARSRIEAIKENSFDKSELLEKFHSSKFYTTAVKAKYDMKNFQYRRLLSAFPHMKNISHGEAFESIKKYIAAKRECKKRK